MSRQRRYLLPIEPSLRSVSKFWYEKFTSSLLSATSGLHLSAESFNLRGGSGDDATKEEGTAAKDCKSCSRQNIWPQKRAIPTRVLVTNVPEKQVQKGATICAASSATASGDWNQRQGKGNILSSHKSSTCPNTSRKKQKTGKRLKKIRRKQKKRAKMS